MKVQKDTSYLEIRQIETRLEEAMRTNDLPFLKNIFSEKYLFLGSDGSSWGRKKALDDYMNPQYTLSDIRIDQQKIFMHNDSAVVTGVSLIKGKIGDKPLTGQYRFLRVWHKENNDWKIIALSTVSI